LLVFRNNFSRLPQEVTDVSLFANAVSLALRTAQMSVIDSYTKPVGERKALLKPNKANQLKQMARDGEYFMASFLIVKTQVSN
jgi:hypothetical protein